MDPRGYAYDPNQTVVSSQPKWWEEVGSTLGPSPYAVAAWEYKQTKIELEVEVPVLSLYEVWDNGDIFAIYNQPVDWDGGLIGQIPGPEIVLDGGGFSSSGRTRIVKQTNATVFAYDTKASAPGSLSEIILNAGLLSIDPPTEPAILLTTEDDIELKADEVARQFDDMIPPGVALGQIDYTLIEDTITITEWSQMNWYDDEPVRMAFKAMVNSKPFCATRVEVRNGLDSAFWKSLGFIETTKGAATLRWSDPAAWRPY